MPIIAWKDCYATQIVSLDKEHQGLVEQINRLYTAIREHKEREVLLSIFDALVAYTRQHFSHEEQLLADYNYPELAEHQAIHQQLTEQVLDFRKKLTTGGEVAATEVMAFLRSWLLEHIVKEDVPYGPFLESRGGRFLD